MINFKKEWRWMEDNEHPYYDSKSKKQSYTIAVISMLIVIIMIAGMVIYQRIYINI